MNDPIVDEVRRIRDAHAARFNYDLDAIFADLKERERLSGLKFVNGVARQPATDERAPLIGPTIPSISDHPVSPSIPAAEL